MVGTGMWMRDKESGELVQVKSVGAVIAYANDDVDGEVQADRVELHFDVLDDPSEQADIEALLRAKIKAGEAETGLYDLGLSYVVVDVVDDKVIFQWFSHTIPFSDLLVGRQEVGRETV